MQTGPSHSCTFGYITSPWIVRGEGYQDSKQRPSAGVRVIKGDRLRVCVGIPQWGGQIRSGSSCVKSHSGSKEIIESSSINILQGITHTLAFGCPQTLQALLKASCMQTSLTLKCCHAAIHSGIAMKDRCDCALGQKQSMCSFMMLVHKSNFTQMC